MRWKDDLKSWNRIIELTALNRGLTPSEEREIEKLGKLFNDEKQQSDLYTFEVYSRRGNLEVRGTKKEIADYYGCGISKIYKAYRAQPAKDGLFKGKTILKYTREGELICE